MYVPGSWKHKGDVTDCRKSAKISVDPWIKWHCNASELYFRRVLPFGCKDRHKWKLLKMQVWIGFIMFLATWLELWLAYMGISAPFLFLCAFYFTLIYGWRRMAPFLCVYAVLFELALSRCFPFMLFMGFAVMGGASIWRRYGNIKSFSAQIVPGFCVGALAALTDMLYVVCISLSRPGGKFGFSMTPLLMHVLIGALALPVCCVLLDATAYRFGYSLYGNAYNLSEEDSDGQ